MTQTKQELAQIKKQARALLMATKAQAPTEAQAQATTEAPKAQATKAPRATKAQAPKATKATTEATQPTKQATAQTKIDETKVKHIYGTSGVTWELGPNLEDLKYNKHPEADTLRARLGGMGFPQGKVGKSLKAAEINQANGTISIIPTLFRGMANIHYMVILKATKDMNIMILQGTNYPFTSKKQALQAGRDNREYTFQNITTITIKAGQVIPLGITTNYGKASNNYQGKWSTLYQVGIDTKTYDTYQTEARVIDWTGNETFKEIGRHSNKPTGKEGKLTELLGIKEIINPMAWVMVN